MSTYEGTEDTPPLAVIIERQRGMARTIGDLLKWRNGRDGMDSWRAVTDKRLDDQETQMAHLAESVDGLRKVILGLAVSIAGSAVVFALSVLVATGKLGG